MKFIRSRVQAGEALFGTFINLGSPLTAEIVAAAGYDWVLIDLEHGAGDERDALSQMQAFEHTAATPLIRIEVNSRPRVHRVLDFGAAGVMVPRVETVEDARQAVSHMKYPPAGIRGVALMNRACGFGGRSAEYLASADAGLLTILQIESPRAVENAAAIAAIDGVDVLFVGPADLSQAMGIFGRFDDPGFRDAITETGQAARQHGKAAGVLLPNLDSLEMYWTAGYRFIGCSSDSRLLRIAATGQVSQFRERASLLQSGTRSSKDPPFQRKPAAYRSGPS